MEIREEKKAAVNILSIEGRLDSNTSGILENRIMSLLEHESKDFVIDFSGMDYISSAGLRVLLMAAKKTKTKGGKVVLSALCENVREVFEMSGFISIFDVFDTKDEAVGAF